MLLQLSQFSPFPLARPPLVHVHGSSTFIFGFSISYTILILPCLFGTYQFVLLNPCTFSPILTLPPPTDNPPCDLHFCDSVPVLPVHLVHFCLCFFRFGC